LSIKNAGGLWRSSIIFIFLDGQMKKDTYISNVTVDFEATDDYSGVEFTYYQIDDGEWYEYDTSLMVSEPGTHSVDFYSIDKAGNCESEKRCEFTVRPLQIVTMNGGIGIELVIKNLGISKISNVDITVSFDGGLFIYPRTVHKVISLEPEAYAKVHINPVIGVALGLTATPPMITVTVDSPYANKVTSTQPIKLFLMFVKLS
jgi:hypothetical protein